MGKLLIITPTLNRSPYLGETIASVRSYAPEVEHILSAPSSEIEVLRARYPTLRVVADKGREGGMYGAINAGIEAAESDWEWFTYINDDDVLYQGFSNMLLKHLSHPKPEDFGYGIVQHIDQQSLPIYTISVCPWPRCLKYFFSTQMSPISQQGMLIKRTAMETVGLLDSSFKYAGDREYWCRLLTSGARFKFHNEEVAGFRICDGQLSQDITQFSAERSQIKEMYFKSPNRITFALIKLAFRLYNLPKYAHRISRLGLSTSDQIMAPNKTK